MRKIIVITGCSSGIGRELTKMYLQERQAVFGIGEEDLKVPNLVYVRCDLVDTERLEKVIQKIKDTVPHIDLLINNAGVSYAGPSENFTLEEIRRQFDINTISQIHFTNQLLPLIKKSRQGKIVFNSSLAATFPTPYQSIYAASKAAISNYAYSLTGELAQFNTEVIVNEIGNVATPFTDHRIKIEPSDEYTRDCLKTITKQEMLERTGLNAIEVARKIKANLDKDESKVYMAIGKNAGAKTFFSRFLPKKALHKIIKNYYSK